MAIIEALDSSSLNYLYQYWYVFIAILVFLLMLIIIKLHKTPKVKQVTMEEARRLAESKIIEEGIPLQNTQIEDPLKEASRGVAYWSVKYMDKNRNYSEIIILENGNIVEGGISKEKALEIAKKEFENRGVDMIRVKFDEESKKIKGRDYWIVRYTTSYGFSDKVMISKKMGLISY